MVDTKKLHDKIIAESITCQIADGWETPHVIAKHIVGTDTWNSLEELDKIILKARVHKVIRDNKLL